MNREIIQIEYPMLLSNGIKVNMVHHKTGEPLIVLSVPYWSRFNLCLIIFIEFKILYTTSSRFNDSRFVYSSGHRAKVQFMITILARYKYLECGNNKPTQTESVSHSIKNAKNMRQIRWQSMQYDM